MNEPESQLWARRPHARHAELFDAEYAKQLERIARIRSEVSESLPLPPVPEGPVPELVEREPPASRWDDAPADFAPAPTRPATPHRTAAPRPASVRAARRRPWLTAAGQADDVSGRPRKPAAAAQAGGAPGPRRLAAVAQDGNASRAAGAARPRLADAAHGVARIVPRRPRLADAAHGVARIVRRRPWLVAVVALAVLVAGGVLVLATRAPDAPAATVFRVPGQATGLVASGGQLWVAGPMAGAVWILDGATGRPAAPAIRTGGTPARVVLDRHFAWVADTERGVLVRARRDGSGTPQPISAGPDVADVVIAAGAVWTASSADGTVRVLGPGDRRRVLHVGARPIALAADAEHVVAVDANGTLIRLDARARRAAGPPVALGGAPVDVALTGDAALVADASAGTVRAVSLSSGLIGSPVRVCRSPVALAADARDVYVLCRSDRTLVRLDLKGNVRSRLQLGHVPTALALDTRHVWIAAGTNEVIRVDR